MVKINGQESDAAGMTVSQYISTTDYNIDRIAVEKNEQIVPKMQYGTTVIEDGDTIEIVSFVGGG
ncbi:MAG: sulfur carrier protein ThiS [Lachnospiraceae bacterium]|nr:sulfur carrier protein ThiS [Lachnospiraceae bacterium]